jgi:putative nucleotidyltransferase with HDIG domain
MMTILIAVLLAGISWFVWNFGETAPSYNHLYYIPIVLAAVFFRYVGAAITGVSAATLSGLITFYGGNAMPGDKDIALDIAIRLAFFFAIGILTAGLTTMLALRGEEAATLFSASQAVNQSLRLEEVLPAIARMAGEISEGRASLIRLLGPKNDELLPAASWRLSPNYLAKGPVRLAENSIDENVMRGEVVMIPDVRRDPRTAYPQEASAEGIVSCICVPIQRGGRYLGVLRVYSDYPRHWSRHDQRLLRALASEAAVAIENAQLHENLRRSYWETVRSLTRAIEAKDPQALGHSERVTGYALQIGRALQLSAEEMENLRFAATLHDIGKIAVEEQLVRTPTSQAYREALERNHPLVGMSILQPAEFLRPAIDAVRYHHENYDGSGYPDGLKGEAIPLLARILGVANAFDHLVNPGYEGLALSPEKALEELKHQADTMVLDAKIVEAFAGAMGRNH